MVGTIISYLPIFALRHKWTARESFKQTSKDERSFSYQNISILAKNSLLSGVKILKCHSEKSFYGTSKIFFQGWCPPDKASVRPYSGARSTLNFKNWALTAVLISQALQDHHHSFFPKRQVERRMTRCARRSKLRRKWNLVLKVPDHVKASKQKSCSPLVLLSNVNMSQRGRENWVAKKKPNAGDLLQLKV